jgi:hypothetical protein
MSQIDFRDYLPAKLKNSVKTKNLLDEIGSDGTLAVKIGNDGYKINLDSQKLIDLNQRHLNGALRPDVIANIATKMSNFPAENVFDSDNVGTFTDFVSACRTLTFSELTRVDIAIAEDAAESSSGAVDSGLVIDDGDQDVGHHSDADLFSTDETMSGGLS